jgi:hypothetical protein
MDNFAKKKNKPVINEYEEPIKKKEGILNATPP